VLSDRDKEFIVPATKFNDAGYSSLFLMNFLSIITVFVSAVATYFFSKLCLNLLNRVTFRALSKE
jgi:hypothetical protein